MKKMTSKKKRIIPVTSLFFLLPDAYRLSIEVDPIRMLFVFLCCRQVDLQ